MLSGLIELANEVFPAISQEVTDGAKIAMEQFNKNGKKLNFTTNNSLEQLSQGDVITNVGFCYYDDYGNQFTFKSNGMVLSTSCHIDQKEKLLICPVFSQSEFCGNNQELQSNRIFQYMYLHSQNNLTMGHYADFSIVNTFNKQLIFNGIENKKMGRLISLNQIGYYVFITKLSIYLMRVEDSDTQKYRASF
jgi:hypothetical protein